LIKLQLNYRGLNLAPEQWLITYSKLVAVCAQTSGLYTQIYEVQILNLNQAL